MVVQENPNIGDSNRLMLMVDAMAITAMKTIANMNFYMMANEKEWNRKQAAAFFSSILDLNEYCWSISRSIPNLSQVQYISQYISQ